MGSPLTLGDLPSDWFERHGQEIIDELATNRLLGYVGGRRMLFWRQIQFDPPRLHLVLTSQKLSAPLTLVQASRFYNAAGFCYLMSPSESFRILEYLRRIDHGRFDIRPMMWLKEAFDVWAKGTPEEKNCDEKLPFAPVSLGLDLSRELEKWADLGIRSDLDQQAADLQQQASLTLLIEQHR